MIIYYLLLISFFIAYRLLLEVVHSEWILSLMIFMPTILTFYYNKTLSGKKLWKKLISNLIWFYYCIVITLSTFVICYKDGIKNILHVFILPFKERWTIPFFALMPVMAIWGNIYYSNKVQLKIKNLCKDNRKKEILLKSILMFIMGLISYCWLLLLIFIKF